MIQDFKEVNTLRIISTWKWGKVLRKKLGIKNFGNEVYITKSVKENKHNNKGLRETKGEKEKFSMSKESYKKNQKSDKHWRQAKMTKYIHNRRQWIRKSMQGEKMLNPIITLK